jgi:enterochelin esterase-like enzyme
MRLSKHLSGSLSQVATAVIVLGACSLSGVLAQSPDGTPGLNVQLSFEDGLLNGSVDGRIVVMFAPAGVEPLEDTDVTSSPNLFFGMNVYEATQGNIITLAGGSGDNVLTGVYGWPNVSLNDVAPGDYSVQAFLNPYEKVCRSDGSCISVHFPCGDGAPNVDGVGSFITPVLNFTINESSPTVSLAFNNITMVEDFTGTEIGGCSQGNYEDTETLKYLKIRSEALSNFWGRDMYVGANIVLPAGYNSNNTSERYPVIYAQGHWAADSGAFRYPTANFSEAWDNGVIPGENGAPDRPTPKMILVSFRHETAFYDDSYAVNTANIGPYGDAINDELIPQIDATFNTIPEPYARVQTGGSTGGWESAASLIFRPDLFGVCFSSYPDSLDFHRHQDIPLYTNKNAYVRENGSAIASIRDFPNGTQEILATVAQENHWELTFGTNSRSSLQWDVWNAVFGAQAINGYPLEPWNKVTGEIYPGAVEYWKHMDLANYIVSNWDNDRNLGEILRNRVFIYVGSWDDYFLNEGVMEFQKTVEAKGGANWANVTILPEKPHGGNYQAREIWDYLELMYSWIQDHSPTGKTPLSSAVTIPSSRGNTFEEVMSYGGHQAALARQAPPSILAGECSNDGCAFEATVGRWDPGVTLEAVWLINGKPSDAPCSVAQGQNLTYSPAASSKNSFLQLSVTGRKYNYVDETRVSNKIAIKR